MKNRKMMSMHYTINTWQVEFSRRGGKTLAKLYSHSSFKNRKPLQLPVKRTPVWTRVRGAHNVSSLNITKANCFHRQGSRPLMIRRPNLEWVIRTLSMTWTNRIMWKAKVSSRLGEARDPEVAWTVQTRLDNIGRKKLTNSWSRSICKTCHRECLQSLSEQSYSRLST